MLSPVQNAVPASVGRYLLPSERLIAVVRPHLVVLVRPTAVALGGIAAAAGIAVVPQNPAGVKVTAWTLAFFLVLRWLYLGLAWVVDGIALTETRLVLMSGVLSRRILSYDLQDLRYCTFERSFGGRLLGYGTISFGSGTQSRTLIDFLPYPEQIYLLINGTISPDLADAGGYALAEQELSEQD